MTNDHNRGVVVPPLGKNSAPLQRYRSAKPQIRLARFACGWCSKLYLKCPIGSKNALKIDPETL